MKKCLTYQIIADPAGHGDEDKVIHLGGSVDHFPEKFYFLLNSSESAIQTNGWHCNWRCQSDDGIDHGWVKRVFSKSIMRDDASLHSKIKNNRKGIFKKITVNKQIYHGMCDYSYGDFSFGIYTINKWYNFTDAI